MKSHRFLAVGEELHVHGYDLFLDLEAGTEGVLQFTANVPGILR